MLRVWGGGFYEDETFTTCATELGILVWQDCIFACSIYPLNDPEFLENVRVEMFENIQRLRHRASLALWCGNNEMEQGWESWAWEHRRPTRLRRMPTNSSSTTPCPNGWPNSIPITAYWPSSPSSNTPFKDVNSADARRHALLGCLARAQTVYRLPQPVTRAL